MSANLSKIPKSPLPRPSKRIEELSNDWNTEYITVTFKINSWPIRLTLSHCTAYMEPMFNSSDVHMDELQPTFSGNIVLVKVSLTLMQQDDSAIVAERF